MVVLKYNINPEMKIQIIRLLGQIISLGFFCFCGNQKIFPPFKKGVV